MTAVIICVLADEVNSAGSKEKPYAVTVTEDLGKTVQYDLLGIGIVLACCLRFHC